MIEFNDMIYGKIRLPDWIEPFLTLPEFVRLRDVRLSNVDSFQFKDFSRTTRWEHGIATAFLASRCARKRNLGLKEEAHLTLAALLHDVATPPYGHTVERLIEGYNHELETQRVLSSMPSLAFNPDIPVFESQLPQFWKTCKQVSRKLRTDIDADEIAQMIVGEGDLGFLICGTMDLDNADNVVRACLLLGLGADKDLPLDIADWLALQRAIPTDLENLDERCVTEWLHSRNQLYRHFYQCASRELGRQAFLEHLIRRAIDEGLPRNALIWSTDSSLLNAIEGIKSNGSREGASTLSGLVQRYRLVEAPFELARVDIFDDEAFRVLASPLAMQWIEKHLSSEELEIVVTLVKRRYTEKPGYNNGTLFPASIGYVYLFKLGQGISRGQMPDWLKGRLPKNYRGSRLQREFERIIGSEFSNFIKQKPWIFVDHKRKERVVENLRGAGNWSFRLSKNESMHAYPSTFVHAIPSTLMASLGLAGDLVVDCFGGTGQTAVEAIKQGGRAITSDINAVATLAAEAKLTYITKQVRSRLADIRSEDILGSEPDARPEFPLMNKWFHEKTIEEMLLISGFSKQFDHGCCETMLKATFSAVITSCTGRRGEQHGYFADNTPLPRGESIPPYQNAIDLFLGRLKKNLISIDKLYAFFERQGRSPAEELKRATVLRLDAKVAGAKDYGVAVNSVGGIITSPPYLCMADYTLGQRLSYYWIFPDQMDGDYRSEMGARRQRFSPKAAADSYFHDLALFARKTTELLRPGGYLGMVMGAPVAESFKQAKVLEKVDQIFAQCGFTILWSCMRPVQWHRNHGYSRLKEERVSVHILE